MIHVIATITANPGARKELLRHMLATVPRVLAEEGCHGYLPTVDLPSGLPAQAPRREDTIVLIESWRSLAHLRAHLEAPHMVEYRAKAKPLVAQSSLQVLEEAVVA